MENLRIGIAGNIGAGKSTIVEKFTNEPFNKILLSAFPNSDPKAKVHSYPENFNEEVLDAFYKDPVRHALMAQIEFFNGRLERERKLSQTHGIVLEDRILSEDYHIFGMAQRILGNMTEPEFLAYQRNYRLMSAEMGQPDVVLYLRADVETLQKRIAKRGRVQEKKIPNEYLETLNGLYEEFVSNHLDCPVIPINANEDALDDSYYERIAHQIVDQIKLLGLRITTSGLHDWVSLPETEATIKSISTENELAQYLKENPSLITIAGNVALGKSTLTAIMTQSLGIEGLYEKPEKNPLLFEFLADKKTHAYNLQLHFLDMRSNQRKIAKNGGGSYVKDRSLPEDLLIFSRDLHREGYMTEDQLDLLRVAFRQRCDELPQADVMVVLQGSAELAYQRMLQRGREAEVEGGWTPESLKSMGNLYRTYGTDVVRQGFHKGPVVEIDVDKINLLNRSHAGYVFEQIYEALAGEKPKL
jgi:deoxyadenosine/deoxycytidine kinase